MDHHHLSDSIIIVVGKGYRSGGGSGIGGCSIGGSIGDHLPDVIPKTESDNNPGPGE